MNTLAIIGGMAGGVGLFLLGMVLMSDGLKLAAGPALERILADSTKTRLRGPASGITVTALVQSSSAVTVAAIGFANAGLLNLSQACPTPRRRSNSAPAPGICWRCCALAARSRASMVATGIVPLAPPSSQCALRAR